MEYGRGPALRNFHISSVIRFYSVPPAVRFLAQLRALYIELTERSREIIMDKKYCIVQRMDFFGYRLARKHYRVRRHRHGGDMSHGAG